MKKKKKKEMSVAWNRDKKILKYNLHSNSSSNNNTHVLISSLRSGVGGEKRETKMFSSSEEKTSRVYSTIATAQSDLSVERRRGVVVDGFRCLDHSRRREEISLSW